MLFLTEPLIGIRARAAAFLVAVRTVWGTSGKVPNRIDPRYRRLKVRSQVRVVSREQALVGFRQVTAMATGVR